MVLNLAAHYKPAKSVGHVPLAKGPAHSPASFSPTLYSPAVYVLYTNHTCHLSWTIHNCVALAGFGLNMQINHGITVSVVYVFSVGCLMSTSPLWLKSASACSVSGHVLCVSLDTTCLMTFLSLIISCHTSLTIMRRSPNSVNPAGFNLSYYNLSFMLDYMME